MKIDEKFLKLIEHNNTLNQEQLEILGIDLKDKENWKNIALQKDVSKNDINLLMLLRQIDNLEYQKQIIKNYHIVLEHNNIKAKVYTTNIEHKESEKIKIYCDGACSGNPGNAGSGLAIYENNKNPVLLYGAFVENGTNNIAELNALCKALLIASNIKTKNIISIFSDSKYVIDCITTWAYSWKQNNWSKKDGEIKNLELIQEAFYLYEKIKNKIQIYYVKGHSGIQGNELADKMAIYAIKQKNKEFKTFEYKKIEDILKV